MPQAVNKRNLPRSKETGGEAAQPAEHGNIAATSVAADVEYRTPDPFDAQASATAIVSEARGIQALLKLYEDNTRKLKEDVQEFVLREVEEQSKHKTISVTIAQDELTSLQNSDYIKFTHAYHAADVDTDEVMPTTRMRKGSLVAAERSVSSVGWATVDHPWSPDGAVSLASYGDVREVLLGWRSKNDASTQSFHELCADAFPSAAVPLCCYFNGQLYTPPTLCAPENEAACKATLQTSFWNCFDNFGGNSHHRAIDAATHTFINFTTAGSSMTRKQLEHYLWSNARAPSKDPESTAGNSLLDNFAPQIIGDAHDHLVVVVPNRLVNTHTFRGFFIRGALIAVEHVGPQVDVLRLLCTLPGSDATMSVAAHEMEAEKARIVATFQHLFAVYSQADPTARRSVVMTLALAPEGIPTCGEVTSPHAAGVVLGFRPIGPALPFLWHFTWAEICSLGQMMGQVKGTKDTSRVVFKATRLAVAGLTATDVLGSLYFDTLNDQIARAQAGSSRPDLAELKTGAHLRSAAALGGHRHGDVTTVFKVAVAAAAVSTVVAAATLVLKRR